ncbi:MAG: hypothetical protein M3Q77_07520 [Thermoproteota archaeon]|nr:hypothetical protein [Thermoproteota archaeon]
MNSKYCYITMFIFSLPLLTNFVYGSIDNDLISKLTRNENFNEDRQSIISNPSTNCNSEETISNSCNINECLTIGHNSCNTSHSPNNIDSATILVEKENEGTGSAVPSNFEIHVTGKNADPQTFQPDYDRPVTVVLSPGEYRITEETLTRIGPAYVISYSQGCEGTIQGGETKRCIITNTEDFAQIRVLKEIVGDSDTTPSIGNFTYSMINNGELRSNSHFSNSIHEIIPGTYEVFETGDYSQHASYSDECSGTITNGELKTCIITNTFD